MRVHTRGQQLYNLKVPDISKCLTFNWHLTSFLVDKQASRIRRLLVAGLHLRHELGKGSFSPRVPMGHIRLQGWMGTAVGPGDPHEALLGKAK